MSTSSLAIVGALISSVLGSFGAFFMKIGSAKITRKIFVNFYNKYLYIAVCFQLISSVVFIISLKFGDVSVLYPFVALSYVWASILAVKFLGERMNKYKWIGIVFILIGVSFIGLGA